MILFPPRGFPLWVAAPAHCEQRDSWEEFGGQECVDCAAVAICIGLCYLWLCIFAQKAPSHFLRQLPTQVWCPWGFPAASTLPPHIMRPTWCFFSPIQCGFTSAHSFIQQLCPVHLLSVRGCSRPWEFWDKWGANISLRSLRAAGEDWRGIYLVQAFGHCGSFFLKKQNIFLLWWNTHDIKFDIFNHFFENKFSGIMYIRIAIQPSPFLSF